MRSSRSSTWTRSISTALSEVMGPGVAQECIETKDGLTIWEDHFYPEVIDPETGRVLPDGEKGELVFTSLTKEALPIIRYRTRDLTRLLPPQRRVRCAAWRKITGAFRRHDDHSRRQRVSDAGRGADSEAGRLGAALPARDHAPQGAGRAYRAGRGALRAPAVPTARPPA